MKKIALSGIFTAFALSGLSAFANTHVNLQIENNLTSEYSPTYNASTQDSKVNPQWGGVIPQGVWISSPGTENYSGELADNNHISFGIGVAYNSGQQAIGNFQVSLKDANNLVFTASDFQNQPYSDVRENQMVTMKITVDGNEVGEINTSTKNEIIIPADESSDITVKFTSNWSDIPAVPVDVTINNNTNCTTDLSGQLTSIYLGDSISINLSCKDIDGTEHNYLNSINIDQSGGIGFTRSWMDAPYADEISMTCDVQGQVKVSGPGNENLYQQYSQWDLLANGGSINCKFDQIL